MAIEGPNSLIIKNQVLFTNNNSLMQHLDFEPVQTERPGELTAYYKIARKSFLLGLCHLEMRFLCPFDKTSYCYKLQMKVRSVLPLNEL